MVVVGYTDDEESVKMSQLGAQRSVNVKYYLVNGEGGSNIDATRIDVRTSGTVKEKGAKIYFVPSGTTFSQESVAVGREPRSRDRRVTLQRPRKLARRTRKRQRPAPPRSSNCHNVGHGLGDIAGPVVLLIPLRNAPVEAMALAMSSEYSSRRCSGPKRDRPY